MKPLIGISTRALNENVHPWLPRRQGLFDSYIEAITAAGGIPIAIPLLDNRQVLKDYFNLVGGILFAGGGDVHPELYHQKSQHKLQRPNIVQDKNELILASWAVLEQKPILGICRGMQLINVALGGTLSQDLRADEKTDFDHNDSENHKDFSMPVHTVEFNKDSLISKVTGIRNGHVNSIHHQGIEELANDLKATAWAPDGIIEAAEGLYHPYLMLVQFHPELLVYEHDPRWGGLFADFVNQALRPRSRHIKPAMSKKY